MCNPRGHPGQPIALGCWLVSSPPVRAPTHLRHDLRTPVSWVSAVFFDGAYRTTWVLPHGLAVGRGRCSGIGGSACLLLLLRRLVIACLTPPRAPPATTRRPASSIARAGTLACPTLSRESIERRSCDGGAVPALRYPASQLTSPRAHARKSTQRLIRSRDSSGTLRGCSDGRRTQIHAGCPWRSWPGGSVASAPVTADVTDPPPKKRPLDRRGKTAHDQPT